MTISQEQAVRNGHSVGRYASGMCQRFVREQCWQVGSMYGSAIAAWNGARYKHAGDRTPPVGAPVYYRGGNYGHAVIYCGPNHPGIRSTDCYSSWAVSDATLDWPERAWGYTYLGWTEDINGVRVIQPEKEDDMPLNDNDLHKIASRVNKALGDFNADGKNQNPDNKDPEYGDQRLRQVEKKVDDLQDKVNRLIDMVKAL